MFLSLSLSCLDGLIGWGVAIQVVIALLIIALICFNKATLEALIAIPAVNIFSVDLLNNQTCYAVVLVCGVFSDILLSYCFFICFGFFASY